jgi:glycosyltransferase involved in cell wall biosynthesis
MTLDIALVNNQDQCGGAETVMWQLHRGLLQQGHRSSVYMDQYDRGLPDSHRHGLCPAWIDRLDHSRFHGMLAKWAPRSRWTDAGFRRLLKSGHGLVHIHNFHGIYATVESLAALSACKPVVWTFHRFWGITGGCDHPADCPKYLEACGGCPLVHEWPMNGLDNTAAELERKTRVLGPAPLCIVAPSLHLAEKVRGSRVGKNWRVEHIPNGVDVARFRFERKSSADFRRGLGLDHGKTTVLVANRNFRDPLKGFDVIEAALRDLPASNLQVVFMGGEAEWAVSRLSPRHAPVAAGYVADREKLADWYEASDIFLYASPRENFPCVILEAMASGCCVVSTPTDGVREQFEHGRSGWLADSFAPADLARLLAEVLASKETVQQTGLNARRHVTAHFSEGDMINAHLRLYGELTDENQRLHPVL